MKCFLFIYASFILCGCEKILIKDSENSPKEVFNILWHNFDRHYPAFVIKNIDWDSVYVHYDSMIKNDMASDELFTVLSKMLRSLKDGHTWLSNGKSLFSYYNDNFNYYYKVDIVGKYLKQRQEKYMFIYGKLADNIGYIHISTFFSSKNGYEYIDDILEEFKDCKGIVLDVRSNTGGFEGNAKIIASKFYDKERNYSYDLYRDGTGHNDFSDKYYKSIEPEGDSYSNIKLVLITDRSVGSSGEDFTMMLNVLPQLTVIGDTTHGNPGGTPNARELPNGWLYYMPTSLEYTMDNQLVYDGIPPDIVVTSVAAGRDLMIEKAIKILQ